MSEHHIYFYDLILSWVGLVISVIVLNHLASGWFVSFSSTDLMNFCRLKFYYCKRNNHNLLISARFHTISYFVFPFFAFPFL